MNEYKFSTDYERLWELIQSCDYSHCDVIIKTTYGFESIKNVCLNYEKKADFIQKCREISLHFIEPPKKLWHKPDEVPEVGE